MFSSNRRGRDNTTKDTYHNVLSTKGCSEYRIAQFSAPNEHIFDRLLEEINEFAKAGVTALPSETNRPYRVKEAYVR